MCLQQIFCLHILQQQSNDGFFFSFLYSSSSSYMYEFVFSLPLPLFNDKCRPQMYFLSCCVSFQMNILMHFLAPCMNMKRKQKWIVKFNIYLEYVKMIKLTDKENVLGLNKFISILSRNLSGIMFKNELTHLLILWCQIASKL